MNTRPIENSTWSRCEAPYRRRYSVRSSTTPTPAQTTTTMGSVTRNGAESRESSSTQTYPPSIANAPCARFTKFMSPSVTDSPTLMRNRSMPDATPSKSTVIEQPPRGDRQRGGGGRGRPPPRRSLLARILHVRNLVEFDVLQLASDLFHLADVDRLHDVARLRIDGDLAARADPAHALGGRDEFLRIGAAAGFLQHFGNELHAVVAGNRHEVGPVLGIRLGIRVGVRLVLRRLVHLSLIHI